MPDDAPIEKLLQAAFKEPEREYLAQHPLFQQQKAKTPHTTYGFECLVEIGSLLLRQREDLALLLKRQKDNA